MNQRSIAFLLGLFVATTSRLLWANGTDSTLARAVAAKELALDHPTNERWRETYARFLDADHVRHTRETQYELGLAAAQLQSIDVAAGHFAEALALGLTEPARSKALSFIAEQEPKLGRLHLEGKPLSEVWVLDQWRASLPIGPWLYVTPGRVVIRLVDPADRSVTSRTLDILPGESRNVSFAPTETETPRPTPSPPTAQPAVPPSAASHPAAPRAARPFASSHPAATKAQPNSSAPQWLVGAGIGTIAASTTLLAVSMVKLAGKRDDLKKVCEVPLSGSDNGCASARPGRYDDALELSRDVASWRTAEAISVVGLGLGVVSTAIGFLIPRTKSPVHAWLPEAAVGQRGIRLGLTHRF